MPLFGQIWSKVQDNECLSFFKENDFVFLCEVWCDKVPEILGYFSFYKLKKKVSVKGRIPGGLIIYLKEKFKNDVEIIGTTMEEVIWIKLKSEKCLFAIVYRHPDNSKFFNSNFFQTLNNELNERRIEFPEFEILIIGDFNARVAGNEETENVFGNDNFENVFVNSLLELPNRKSKDKVLNKPGRQLLELCSENNFVILNGRSISDIFYLRK